MKQTLIPTIAGDVLVVEVEKDVTQYDWFKFGYTIRKPVYNLQVYTESKGWHYPHKPFEIEGSLLGMIDADTCTVENCEGFVEFRSMKTKTFCDYGKGQEMSIGFDNPTDSFRSLLEANGVVFENKFGDKKPTYQEMCDAWIHPCDFDKNIEQWQQEQQRVWGKAVIILINKKEWK